MIFQGLKKPPIDEIFSLNQEFQKDPRKNKINGGIGVYLDEEGRPFVNPAIKKAQKLLTNSNFNYLPIRGEPTFLNEASKLLLGKNLFEEMEDRLAVQSVVGGTNGLYIWGLLTKRVRNKPSILISNPTWENHERIFRQLGFKVHKYNHLTKKQTFDLESLKKALLKNKKSILLLHAGSTHNPTGANPSYQEWKELAKLVKSLGIEVLFDFAYMGLDEDVETDSFAIRLFVEKKIPTSVTVSFSKNMTLYQHRTGVLLVVGKNSKNREVIQKNLENIFRLVNSNPAAYGPLLAKTVLESKELKKMWLQNLKKMSASIKKRRELFAKFSNGRFDYVANQFGLFSLLDLTPQKINQLKNQHGIYLLSNGRINFAGIALKNIKKITQLASA